MHVNKSLIILFLFLFIFVVESYGQNGKMSWFKRTFKELTFDEVILKVHTPVEICSSVKHRVMYRSDVVDEWATGKEAWDRSYGDCEDIATTIHDICSKKNIWSKMFMFYPENGLESHVIVVGNWKGKIWFASNGWFEYVSSVSDIKGKVAHEMRWKGRVKVESFDIDRGLEPLGVSLASSF